MTVELAIQKVREARERYRLAQKLERLAHEQHEASLAASNDAYEAMRNCEQELLDTIADENKETP